MTFSAMALGITDTRRQYLSISTSGGNLATVWDFSTAGFGTRYTAGAGNRPSSTQAWGSSFNPSNSTLSYVGVGGFAVYPWPPTGASFPTKYADPAIMPTTGNVGTQFSPSGKVLAIGPSVYAWSSAGFGTKYTDPVLPEFISNHITWSPSEDVIVSPGINNPYIESFAWNNSTGFGTRYSDPATLPPSATNSAAFSPSGNDIAFSSTSSPFINAYPWSNGFGTKYSNPGTLPTSTGQDVEFSPSGKDIAIAHTSSPAITVYPWTSGSGFGTKYSNPATVPAGNGSSVAFSRSGDTIGVGHSSSPNISAYPWISGVGFGTRYANPINLPNAVNSVVFG